MPLTRQLRRVLNRLMGHGPWRVEPFDEVVRQKRAKATRPLSAPELFDGVVRQVPPDGFLLAPIDFPTDSCYRLGGLAPEPRRELWLLSPGAVAGNAGVVYEPKTRTAVLETVLDWHEPPVRHPLLSAPRFPAARPLPGLRLSLVTLSAEGFWHFLIEALPKLHLAAPWLDRIDHVLVNGLAPPWKQRWMGRAGIGPDRIIWVEGLSHYACEQLLFTPPLVADCLPTPWAVAALREVLLVPNTLGRPTRRIWAARSDAATRRPVWERELASQLVGWECVEFSQLSPDAVIALCGNAAVLAGPHGANLANAVFLPRNATIVEIVPPGPAKPLFHRLAAAAALGYSQLTADFSSAADVARVVSHLQTTSARAPSLDHLSHQ